MTTYKEHGGIMTTYYFVVSKKHLKNKDTRKQFEHRLKRSFESYVEMCKYAFTLGRGTIEILSDASLERWNNELDLIKEYFIYIVTV